MIVILNMQTSNSCYNANNVLLLQPGAAVSISNNTWTLTPNPGVVEKEAFPCTIMENRRSLANKLDELEAQNKTRVLHLLQRLVEHCCRILSPTPTSLPLTIQPERNLKSSKSKWWDGLAELVNNRWCHPVHVIVEYCLYCPDFELLASCKHEMLQLFLPARSITIHNNSLEIL